MLKPDDIDALQKIGLWGGIGAIFSFVRLLVSQVPKKKTDFITGLFVGASVGSLVGWVLEPYSAGLIGGIAPYVAVSAILSERIILFIMKVGSQILDDPKNARKILKKLFDK